MLELIGKTFAGYEIISKLGQGGMGAVYKARQPMLDRLVAIKTIAANRASEPGFVERFMQEAATTAKLNHPNIIQVYTGGEQAGVYYLVEEFVKGESLHDRLHREGRMDPQEALAVCVFIADGLKHAWDAARIIHRDIKPANIFLSNKGAVKVGDLGLAKSVGGPAGSGLTQSGMTMGTPYYCSPEQTRADKDIDFRADIYSLGCTLYQMLSGKKPYEGAADESPMSVMIKQATAPPPAILQIMPDCPSQLVMLLNKMLAKHPSARHANYDALIADLRRLHDLLGQPQANSPISTALRTAVTAKAKKPAPTLLYGGIAAAVIVVLVGGLLLWAPWKEREASGVAPVVEPKPGSESRLQAETAPPQPAKAGTPNAEAPTPKQPEKKQEAVAETAKVAQMPALPAAASAIQNPKSKIQNAPAPVDDAFLAAVAALDPKDQVSHVMDKLLLLNPKFNGKQSHKIENGKVIELTFSTAEVGDLSPLKALPHLQSLTIGGIAQKQALSDLSPLKGLKLAKLAIHSTAVSDLTPLEGMPLVSLQMSNTRVSDLSPLKGAPLAWLSCVDSPVKDLAPLADAPLATLWCGGSQVTDFSPLKTVPLKELSCDFQPERDKETLWAIKTLENINGKPAADFWKEVGAPEDPWFKQVATMPAEQQLAAVMAKLKELNPGFDGKETHLVARDSVAGSQNYPPRSGGLLTELSFSTVAVTNIVPVRALTSLKKLTLLPWAVGRARPPGALSDLSALSGLPLTFLACGNSQVSDLTPLKGMPLTIVSVDNTPVADLTPLAGMPLTILWCNGTKVTDLSPLAGAPLVELRCDVKPEHAPLLASIPTLRKINDLAPAALWMRMRIKPPVPVAAVSDRRNVSVTTTDGGQRPPLQPAVKPGAATQASQPLMTSIGMELLYIPSGEFMMGSTKEEQAWALQVGGHAQWVKSEGEAPRKTAIKQDFWMGKTEVTVGQWKLFVAETGYVTEGEKKGASLAGRTSSTSGRGWVAGASWKDPNFGFKPKDDHPVSCITWRDALAFCKWLNERETKAGGLLRTLSGLPSGYTFRLPTEAEWEYACRAGKQTKFWWGDTKEGGDDRLNWSRPADGFEFVSPVDHYGSRGRNKFGLADMLGNVGEWCLDQFDPAGAQESCKYIEDTSSRVVRGGKFTSQLVSTRCASREASYQTNPVSEQGFRVALGMDLSGKTPAVTPASSDATQKPPTSPRTDAPTLPRSTSAAAARPGQPLMTSTGMELLYIPPGEFMMGSTPEEQAWAARNGGDAQRLKCEGEAPRKTVIKQGFWLGKTEVTVGQWKLFVAATGYVTEGEKRGSSHAPKRLGDSWGSVAGANWKDPNFGFKLKDNHAVSCISWNDAVAFCEWFNEREQKTGRLPPGFKVRLPTEAEWEYACRAGKQTKFWWGETKEDGENRLNWSGTVDGFEFVSPVDHYGLRGRNKFGLADMLGNMREWCLDAFDPAGAHEEPYEENSLKRVARGGMFADSFVATRCAYRETNGANSASATLGFRVAVGPEPSGKVPVITPTSSDATQKPPSAPPTTPAAVTPTPARTDAPRSTSAAAATQPGQPLMTSIGMELLYIPPGEFMMGSTKEEQAWALANNCPPEFIKFEGEAPRKVAIKQGFWLGKTEVTVGQWKLFVASTSYVTDGEKNGESFTKPGPGQKWVLVNGANWKDPKFGFKLKDDHPVSCISWNDAMAFCEWLNEREQKAGRLPPGFKVRLPTEAEWEYACRAGKQTKFWWGETKEDGENRLNWSETADGFEFVSPVDHYGSRGRNKFRLADMLGNVAEWCLDGFDPAGAHEEPYDNKENTLGHVLRGAHFLGNGTYARCAYRGTSSRSNSSSRHGFRVAVGPEPSGKVPAVTPASSDATQKPPSAPATMPAVVTPTPARTDAPRSTSAAAAQPGQPLMTSTGMELLYIPPGEFMMGSTPEERAWVMLNRGDARWINCEGDAPRKTVVKQGFWLGKTEVTVGQWKLFVAATGYVTDGEKRGTQGPQGSMVAGVNWKDPSFGFKLMDNYAVCCISWNDAVAFCEWLNEREQKAGRLPPGFKVRLPTEAEWEYACRAGSQTKFWWGDTKEGGENRLNWSGTADGFEFVAPVDHYGARGRNKFGLADMLGNVWELCLDEYDEKQAHEECYKGNTRTCVVRGGSFHYNPSRCRCAARFRDSLAKSDSNFGFRVAVGPER